MVSVWLQDLEHEAGLLADEGPVGDVGDTGHAANTARV